MSDLASRSAAALRAVMRADRQAHDKRKRDQAAIDLEATKERFPRGVHAGRTRQTTRSTRRLNVRRSADMSPNIIFSIAAGLAYTLWVAGIVEFATHMAPV
jgi:hypothetical protein